MNQPRTPGEINRQPDGPDDDLGLQPALWQAGEEGDGGLEADDEVGITGPCVANRRPTTAEQPGAAIDDDFIWDDARVPELGDCPERVERDSGEVGCHVEPVDDLDSPWLAGTEEAREHAFDDRQADPGRRGGCMQEAEEVRLDRLLALSVLVEAKCREERAICPHRILAVETGDAQPRAPEGGIAGNVGPFASLMPPAVDLQDGRRLQPRRAEEEVDPSRADSLVKLPGERLKRGLRDEPPGQRGSTVDDPVPQGSLVGRVELVLICEAPSLVRPADGRLHL